MLRLSSLAIVALISTACPSSDDTGPGGQCNGQPDRYADDDGDGYGSDEIDCDGVESDNDCDDSDPELSPGADEVCDGIDNDCDGETDNDAVDGTSYWVDADGDGFGGGGPTVLCERPDGTILRGGDCDDDDSNVHPDGVDTFNGLDDDCDGYVDGDGTLCGTVTDPALEQECPQEQALPPWSVIASTNGQNALFLGNDHLDDGCEFPADGYISGDLIYTLYVPPDTECTVTLDDSCDSRMDAFVKRVNPLCVNNQQIYSCYYIDSGATVIPEASFGRLFEIIVGAVDGPGAIFELTVDC